jgi:hypothetical protein
MSGKVTKALEIAGRSFRSSKLDFILGLIAEVDFGAGTYRELYHVLSISIR